MFINAASTGMLAALLFSRPTIASESNLIANGGFENGLDHWSSFWSRDMNAGTANLDSETQRSGTSSICLTHTGANDWSIHTATVTKTEPGEIYEFTGWLKGKGNASLSVVTRKADESVMSWMHGGKELTATGEWTFVRSRFLIPPEIATIHPRITGNGPATIWVDDVVLRRTGSVEELRTQGLPDRVAAGNGSMEVVLRTRDAAITVNDLSANRKWTQQSADEYVVIQAKSIPDGIDFTLLDAASTRELTCRLRLEAGQPEFILEIASTAEEPMETSLAFPPPFSSANGEHVILPLNEGISYPVDDDSIHPVSHYLYGGHGLCMPWYGSTDGKKAWIAIVETPDDADVRMDREEGLFCLQPRWVPQKGRFGDPRRIRYRFFNEGGYVAMAKRYRRFAKETGLLKTLAEKRKANPHVELLVGAVNVWCWDKDAVPICREMQGAGIDRILWSHRLDPEALVQLNEMGVLTSRYDIYQDAMDPKHFSKLRGIHSDWTSGAWERDDIMVDASGNWVRGWRVKAKDGSMIPCGVLCDRQAVPYARDRIPVELETHPYRSRFIDTTTASPWRECYHPDHPMTRTDSKRAKMELLRYMSEGCGLVCGSETGHDAAVPYVHYFEGMMSLGPYRVPDAGRAMMETWDEVPERVAKFQTGHRYRLPLWELVYHDCVVAQWYWGDYNNKLPGLWDRRDLWNALYGTPPMFMFHRNRWNELKDRFARSYRTATPVARATGYSELLSHEWLTPDHAVQRTRFANGVEVTVNFGDKPYSLEDGSSLAPLGHRVTGIK